MVVNEAIIVFAVGAFVRAALTLGPATTSIDVHGLRNSIPRTTSSYGCITAGDHGTSTLICRYSDALAGASTTYAVRIPSVGSWTVSRPVFFLVLVATLTVVSLALGGWKAVRLALGRGTEASRVWTWSWLGLYGAFGALCAATALVILGVT